MTRSHSYGGCHPKTQKYKKEVLHRDESTNFLCQSLPGIKESERKRRRRKEHDTFSSKETVRCSVAK